MNTNLSPVLDILYKAETARKEGCRRVCELLSPVPPSTITRILIGNDNEHGAVDAELLGMVAQTVKDDNIKWDITDWPFENFWGNPYEPQHTQLLGYFLDPQAGHGCGSLLLGKLFEELGLGDLHVDENTKVDPEYTTHADEGGGKIDILISRDCSDRHKKYAVVIENKVNYASDQSCQLQKYVNHLKKQFTPEQLYVFYLSRLRGCEPTRKSKGNIEKYAKYQPVSFACEIVNWLEASLKELSDRKKQKEILPEIAEGMTDNLKHYLNLIRYLLKQEKAQQMNQEILNKLKQADTLPTLSQVADLQKSATELTECLQNVLARKLLMEIQRILQGRNKNVWICLEDTPWEPLEDVSPYDVRSMYLCIRVVTNDIVSVCFGFTTISPHLYPHFGYMKSGGKPDEQAKITGIIREEADKRSEGLEGPPEDADDRCWYAYCHSPKLDYDDNLVSNNSTKIASLTSWL